MFAHERYSDDGVDESLSELQARLRAEGAASDPPAPTHPHIHKEQGTAARQPLLNQIPERYHDEKRYGRFHDDGDDSDDLDSDEEDLPGCCNTKHENSRVRRAGAYVRSQMGPRLYVVSLLIVLVILSCVNWIIYPELVDASMRGGFINPVRDGQEKLNTIGISRGGEFQHGATKILELDESLIPGGENDPDGQRRLIFVGDIHGCKDELLKLLKKVDFDPSLDHLIAAGDTINKGPHSAGVLDHLIHLNATTVRGNHEDRLIHTAKNVFDAFSSAPDDSMPALQDTDSLVDVTSASDRDARTLKSLRARHLRYIQQMPLILRIRPLPQALKPTTSKKSPIAEEILVVHAGLVPALPLEKQDPYYVTNMRSLHAKSHVPSADRAGKGGKKVGRHNKPWRDVWNWYNDRLFRHESTKGFRKLKSPARASISETQEQSVDDHEGNGDSQDFMGNFLDSAGDKVREYTGRSNHAGDKPQVVVYGHDAKGGLRIKRWSKGMDSGCVKGGRLSALVVNAKGESKVFDVRCRQYW